MTVGNSRVAIYTLDTDELVEIVRSTPHSWLHRRGMPSLISSGLCNDERGVFSRNTRPVPES